MTYKEYDSTPNISQSFILMGVGALVLVLGVFGIAAIMLAKPGMSPSLTPRSEYLQKTLKQALPIICLVSLAGLVLFVIGGVMFSYEKKYAMDLESKRLLDNEEGGMNSTSPKGNVTPQEEFRILSSKAYKGKASTNTAMNANQPVLSPAEKLAEDPWWITWDNIKLDPQILGKGNFGQVQKGSVYDKRTGQTVTTAIKTLRTNKGNKIAEDAYDVMVAEMEIMKKIGYHPNIVNLIGYCEHLGNLFVAIEFAPYGDLKTFLKKARQTRQDMERKGEKAKNPLSTTQMLKFALDVSKGMEHLAKHGIIHRDLAARNILLSEGSYGLTTIAKVADFGLARDMSAVYGIYVKESKSGELPIRWTAPEAIFDHVFTEKSDVWAFGILLWEIVTLGQNPYPDIPQNADFYNKLKLGYRMEKPPDCEDDIFQVMRWCWKTAPSERPTFTLLKKHLEKMLNLRHAQKYISEEGGHSLKNA